MKTALHTWLGRFFAEETGLTPARMLRARVRFFVEETRGSVAVEALMILPVLFWTYASMFVFFDAYRQASINLKAAYTIGDLISRETNAINPDFLDGAHSMFEMLAQTDSNTRLRVTQVRWDEDQEQYSRDWSKVRGGTQALSNADVRELADRLPVMVDEERVILVETWSTYTPPMNVGIEITDLKNFILTRPRFAPQVAWSSN